jgi:hypothetical protein
VTLPRRVALGTMHGKEVAIAPPLAALGVGLVVPEGLDTDAFGTFTGEVPRQGTMLDAARAKARAATQATGLSVALASEGAYGPHPVVPFLAQGRELLLWLDLDRGHEVVETLTDDAPCYDQVEVTRLDDAQAFLTRIGFPGTAVIVAPAADCQRPIAKGIRDRTLLASVIAAAEGPVLLQTDMRAHLNPRRMDRIAALAQRLAARLAQTCPACNAPGWGRLGPGPALPCAWCDGPTLQPGGERHGCPACGASQLVPRPDGLKTADPGHCPQCNP